jgi:hypothetical protein
MSDTAVPSPFVEATPVELSAEERLIESRRRLRTALLQIAHPPKAPVGPRQVLSHKIAGVLRSIPGAAPLIDAARYWWQQHPWRQTARLTGVASEALIGPMVQRHPASAIAAATAAGAALVLLKPWRLVRPRLLVGAASLLLSQSIKSGSAGLWFEAALRLAGASKRSR